MTFHIPDSNRASNSKRLRSAHRKGRKRRKISRSVLRYYQLPYQRPCSVVDSGCDQSYIGLDYTVLRFHGEKKLDNDLVEREVVDAFATVVDPFDKFNRICVVRVNQALWIPDRQESLISASQMEWFGI